MDYEIVKKYVDELDICELGSWRAYDEYDSYTDDIVSQINKDSSVEDIAMAFANVFKPNWSEFIDGHEVYHEELVQPWLYMDIAKNIKTEFDQKIARIPQIRVNNCLIDLRDKLPANRMRGIWNVCENLYCTNDIVTELIRLKQDKIVLLGRSIGDMAIVALDLIGIEKYVGGNQCILKDIEDIKNINSRRE